MEVSTFNIDVFALLNRFGFVMGVVMSMLIIVMVVSFGAVIVLMFMIVVIFIIGVDKSFS
jgi:hypothetical protein